MVETPRLVDLKSLTSEAVSPLFVDLDIVGGDQVAGTFSISTFDDLAFTRTRTCGGAFAVRRRKQHISRSSSHAFFACIPTRGQITLSQEGRICTLSRGDIGLMDSREEYVLEMSDVVQATWLRIAPETMENRVASTSRVVARRVDGSTGVGLLASRLLVTAASQADAVGPPHTAPIGSILMDLLSAAATAGATAGGRDERASASTLQRAKAFIDHHLGEEDLNPEKIASGIGISVRYLADLFCAGGATTMGWVSRRRLELTRLACLDAKWSPGLVAQVAYQHGFKNVSSFNRSFKKAFGLSPTSLMRDAPHGQAGPPRE